MLPPVLVEAIGLSAAVLSTVCWVPQALRAIRTRETKSISLWMQSLLTLGVLLWFVYGLMLSSLPLILANGATLMFVATILGLKLRYG